MIMVMEDFSTSLRFSRNDEIIMKKWIGFKRYY